MRSGLDVGLSAMNRSGKLPVKFFWRNPRIWLAVALGTAAFFLLPASWPVLSRMLVGWDCAVMFFLVAIYLWMRAFTAEQICSHYIEEDPSGPVILVVVTAAALLSLLAIVENLATLRQVAQHERVWHVMLAALTLIASWLVVPTMFTMHYADMFYSAPAPRRPLSFPHTEMPAFWDFAYFSFTIAAACQTADVATTQSSIRKVVIAHEIISLAFNVAILGFAINITAGLLGS